MRCAGNDRGRGIHPVIRLRAVACFYGMTPARCRAAPPDSPMLALGTPLAASIPTIGMGERPSIISPRRGSAHGTRRLHSDRQQRVADLDHLAAIQAEFRPEP